MDHFQFGRKVNTSLVRVIHPKTSASIDLCVLETYQLQDYTKEPQLNYKFASPDFLPPLIEIPPKLPQFSFDMMRIALQRNKKSICVWVPCSHSFQNGDKFSMILKKMDEKKLCLFIPLASNGLWLSLFPVQHLKALHSNFLNANGLEQNLEKCLISIIVDSTTMKRFQCIQAQTKFTMDDMVKQKAKELLQASFAATAGIKSPVPPSAEPIKINVKQSNVEKKRQHSKELIQMNINYKTAVEAAAKLLLNSFTQNSLDQSSVSTASNNENKPLPQESLIVSFLTRWIPIKSEKTYHLLMEKVKEAFPNLKVIPNEKILLHRKDVSGEIVTLDSDLQVQSLNSYDVVFASTLYPQALRPAIVNQQQQPVITNQQQQQQ